MVSDKGSLAGLCMQDYKSLCAAVTICSTLVNIQTQTHTQTHRHHLTSLFDKLTSWAKNYVWHVCKFPIALSNSSFHYAPHFCSTFLYCLFRFVLVPSMQFCALAETPNHRLLSDIRTPRMVWRTIRLTPRWHLNTYKNVFYIPLSSCDWLN